MTTRTEEREALIDETEAEVERWSKYVDSLLEAFGDRSDAPPELAGRIEALRHKRDSVVTKAEALRRHKRDGWTRAKRELAESRRELRDSWRTVVNALQRESLFL